MGRARWCLCVLLSMVGSSSGRGGGGGRGGGVGGGRRGRGDVQATAETAVQVDEGLSVAEQQEREKRQQEEAERRLRELEEKLRADMEIANNAQQAHHTDVRQVSRIPLPPPLPDQHTAQDKSRLASLFNKALEASDEEPNINLQDTKPHWAAIETDNGLRSFSFGIVEELSNSIKGRLPCNPLQYVVSHADWLVAYKQTGLFVDIGIGNGVGLRTLAMGFPDREILGVGDPGDVKILENVKIRRGAAGLTTVIAEGNYKEISIAHFSCADFACISMTFSTLKPLFKPGTILIFSKAVGYPSYLEDGLRILYETMNALPDLGFELIGGRHIGPTGHMCLTHRPKHDTCPQSIALRFISPTAARPRVLPGGHMLPKSMPLVSQMCPGLPSLDEQFIRGQAALNTTLNSLKTHLISQISSLVINREESAKREHKLHKTLHDTHTKIQELESHVTALSILVVALLAAMGLLFYKVMVVPKRSSWTR